MELRQGIHMNAKWAIRHYREIVNVIRQIEKKRPRIVSGIRYDTTGVPFPVEQQPSAKLPADRKIVTAYVEGRLIIDIVDAVIAERLKFRDAEIMDDVCRQGMTVPEAAAVHGVSELTVKRARLRMEAAYRDECAARTERGELTDSGSDAPVKRLPEK